MYSESQKLHSSFLVATTKFPIDFGVWAIMLLYTLIILLRAKHPKDDLAFMDEAFDTTVVNKTNYQ